MVTTWKLVGIRSISPSTMRVRIAEFVDNNFLAHHTKDFAKTLIPQQVLTQFAMFIKQTRDQEIADRVPFKELDLSDFETRVQSS